MLVYDICEERVSKVMKVCREYLNHIQNSVFEGEITDSNYRELCSRIRKIIDEETDSVIIFQFWKKNFQREVIGIEKREIGNIL